MVIFNAITKEVLRQRMAGLEPTTLRVSRTMHDKLRQEFRLVTRGLETPLGDLQQIAGLNVVVLEDFSVY